MGNAAVRDKVASYEDCLVSQNIRAAAAGPSRTPQNIGCTEGLQWLLPSGHAYHVCVCVCVYYIYIHTHTHTHIYIYIYSKVSVACVVTPCSSKDMYQKHMLLSFPVHVLPILIFHLEEGCSMFLRSLSRQSQVSHNNSKWPTAVLDVRRVENFMSKCRHVLLNPLMFPP